MEELKKTCIIGITTNYPYDSSEFMNNNELCYKTISYTEFEELYNLINTNLLKSGIEHEKEPVSEPKLLSTNINLMYINECFKSSDIKLIFRFLCSSDCANGELFVNKQITSIVFKFIKLISERECLIEFSDHSMCSFFTNWDNEQMGMDKPIEILKFTHSGEFKMFGKKSDFENSSHPTLKQIGDMSSDENIEIIFNNMDGTKVYKILNSNIIKLLSTGNQLINRKQDNGIYNFSNRDCDISEELYLTVPVHTEFNYNKAKIILSATHWCNLDTVNTPIDIPKLKRYCTENFGYVATQELERELSKTTDLNEQTRIISLCVRDISSGSRTIN